VARSPSSSTPLRIQSFALFTARIMKEAAVTFLMGMFDDTAD
jgi:hypothetical protein